MGSAPLPGGDPQAALAGRLRRERGSGHTAHGGCWDRRGAGIDVYPARTDQWLDLFDAANGWTGAPFGASAPAVRAISGIVHLKGAIATTGSNPVPFTLPAAFRPASAVYVPVGLCNATNGRLQIEPTGVVTVQAEGGAFSNAACFTSLDGASFAP